MSQLAAKLEGDAMAVAYKSVANYVNATTNAVMTYKYFQAANAKLSQNLAPRSDRAAILNPASSVEFMDATKGLFHASANLSEQFKEGSLGYTAGCNVFENTLLPSHTTGTCAGSLLSFGATLGVTTTANSWASQTTMSVTGATSATTLLAGDIVQFSGVYEVNENKVSTGKLKTFVVQTALTMTTAATTYSLVVAPAMIWGVGNGFQNCSIPGGTTTGLTGTLIGAVGTQFGQDLFFHKDAFIFSTVDLEDVSPYGAQCSRATVDNISIRFVQQYAAAGDTVAGRFDVLWGFAPLYPELACRHLYTASLV